MQETPTKALWDKQKDLVDQRLEYYKYWMTRWENAETGTGERVAFILLAVICAGSQGRPPLWILCQSMHFQLKGVFS